MNDQKGPYVVEHHHTWAILSDGNVITMGHPMLNQYPGQTSQPPKPAGPRTILRADFDKMTEEQKHQAAHECIEGKAELVDSLEQKKPAPPPRQLPTFSRASFDALPPSKQSEIAKDCYEGRARLIN